ncbi:ATP-dependent helicase [Kushneria sinocarnis]|uniref:ATP-dependent helicase n=1 Tax=Kushneria sinocarnis TaxID=595502 RepID=UPI002482E04B|nr:ATP-dependent helicase [Kushneria sinocarnis]
MAATDPELTEQQHAVVHHDQGHARVMAVAGAGKTATLVARVLYLLGCGVPAGRLMVLMFNRAAREDFTRRLQQHAPSGAELPRVRTFHSIGHRLTTTLTRWGVLEPRQLLEADWQHERLLKQALQQVLEDDPERLETALETERLETLTQFCDLVKAECCAPERLYERLDYGSDTGHFPAACRALEGLLERQGLMTYADLLYRPLKALRRDRALRDRVGGFLDHVVVDEYQDINEAQLQLLAMLSGGRASVMAVGDANQCIYEWRGARPDAMGERFEALFGRPRDYALSFTFRHGHALALVANHAILANQRRPDQLTLAAPDNPVTRIDQCSGTRALIEQVQHWVAGGRRLDEVAILVRSWTLTVPVQLHFLRQGIPFRLGREDRFVFRLPLVRALAGFLELAMDASLLRDPQHLQLLFEQPTTFVARERLERLCQQLAEHQQWPDKHSPLLSGLRPVQRRNLKKRWTLLCDLPSLAAWSPARLLAHVVDTLDAEKLLRRAAARRDKGEEDIRLLDVLIEQAGELADDPTAFIALLKNPVEVAEGGVLLSTVHGAKGLEWPMVVLWGLNEEDFPAYSREAPLSDAALEEERRLFYVGVTRARESLLLCRDGGQRQASRFIGETAWPDCMRIDRQLKAYDGSTPAVSQPALVQRYLQAVGSPLTVTAGESRSGGTHAAGVSGWRPGERIHHAVFGEGAIEIVEGERERCILEVSFSRAGRRRLVAARAPIERVVNK